MLSSIYILLFGFVIFRIKVFQINNNKPFLAFTYFILKCGCGIGTWIIYSNHFKSGDMAGYMNATETLFQVMRHSPLNFLKAIIGISHRELLVNVDPWNSITYNPLLNDNRTFLLFNLLIRCISFGNIYLQIICLNFLSYTGLLFLYNCFDAEYKKGSAYDKSSGINNLIKYVPFFLPSVLIFGSALLKESLLLFALGFFIKSLQKVYYSVSIKNTLIFLIALVLLLSIKIYLALMILPGIIALIIYKTKPSLNQANIFVFIYCGGLFGLLLIGNFYHQLNFPGYLFGQRLNLLRNAVFSESKSIISTVLFAPEPYSFLRRIPQSIIVAFYHPNPFEINSWFLAPFGFDPIILSIIFIYLFIKRKSLQFLQSPFALICFFSSLLLLMMIGFTIPVLGNLVRFKMPAMLMIGLSFCFVQKNNVKSSDKWSAG